MSEARERALDKARLLLEEYDGTGTIPHHVVAEVEGHIAESYRYGADRQAGYKGAFWRAMRGQPVSPADVRSLAIGTDTAGGFAAPDDFERGVVEDLDHLVPMRQYATILPARGAKIVPVVDGIGGAEWAGEDEALSESDPDFSLRTFRSTFRLGKIIKVSMELAQDGGPIFEALLRRLISRSLAVGEDPAFVAGTGVKQPRGILLDATAAVTAAAQTAVTATEVRRLAHALARPYRMSPACKWLMHADTLEAIDKLLDGAGHSADLVKWGARGEAYLLGHEVLSSPDMPTMTAGSIAICFGDLSSYFVADRPLIVQVVRELYAPQGFIGYIASRHTDGRLVNPAAAVTLTMAA